MPATGTPASMPEAEPAITASPARRRLRGLGAGALACLAAGLLHALCFAPANLWWLELLALAVPLGWALHAPSTRAALLFGFCFALGWLGLGLSWIYISLHHYGQLWAPLAALAVVLLAAGLALLPALGCALAAAAAPAASAGRALALVGAWTLAEWLRGVVLGGMPWLATGYAHSDGPLAGYAAVLGVYGVGALAASCALLPLWAAAVPAADAGTPLGTLLNSTLNLRSGCALRHRLGRNTWRIALGTVGSALVLALGTLLQGIVWTQASGVPLRVRLVQGNIAQDLKFAEGGLELATTRYLPTLHPMAMRGPDDHASHPQTLPPDLIVFPESAFPVPVNRLPDEILDVLADPAQRAGAALVFGAFIVEPGHRYFNSAVGLDGGAGEPQRYSKRHLVPFGEFIPYGFHWFVQLLHIPIGDQEQGERYQPPMALAGQQIAVNICFEDLFGAAIIDAWHDPDREPTVLLNLSNLAWFDDSSALPQHLQISRMRALETGRPLLRATNTGVTALIDADGSVLQQLPVRLEGVLEGSVQPRTGRTPFVRMGNLPTVLLAAALLLGAALYRHRGVLAPRRIS